jgi:hypothetical protein
MAVTCSLTTCVFHFKWIIVLKPNKSTYEQCAQYEFILIDHTFSSWCLYSHTPEDDPEKGSKHVVSSTYANKNWCWHSSVYFVYCILKRYCVDWPLIYHCRIDTQQDSYHKRYLVLSYPNITKLKLSLYLIKHHTQNILNFRITGCEWLVSFPWVFIPRKCPRHYWIGGWMGPRFSRPC